jgi:hypothetical protein
MDRSLKILGHVRWGTCSYCKAKKPKPATVCEVDGQTILLCRPDLIKFIGFTTPDLTAKLGCAEPEADEDPSLFEHSNNNHEAAVG